MSSRDAAARLETIIYCNAIARWLFVCCVMCFVSHSNELNPKSGEQTPPNNKRTYVPARASLARSLARRANKPRVCLFTCASANKNMQTFVCVDVAASVAAAHLYRRPPQLAQVARELQAALRRTGSCGEAEFRERSRHSTLSRRRTVDARRAQRLHSAHVSSFAGAAPVRACLRAHLCDAQAATF